MPRKNFFPKDGWELDVDVPWTMAIHCNDMVILNPQLDEGHHYDLAAQTTESVNHVKNLLSDIGCTERDITNLRIEYVNDGTVDEDAYRASIAKQFPGSEGAAIDMVPFDRLVLPGMMVEICTYAMLHQDGGRLIRQPVNLEGLHHPGDQFAQGVRSGKMIYIGSQVARDASGKVLHPGDLKRQSEIVLDNIKGILSAYGANFNDVVRMNVFYEDNGDHSTWETQAGLCAQYFSDPGPALTAIPLPRIYPEGAVTMMCCWAMLGEDGASLPKQYASPQGHWSWPIPQPWKHACKCEDMIFVGGQASLTDKCQVTHPGDHISQTKQSMKNVDHVLKDFGLGLENVLKTNSYYVLHTVEEFEANLATRGKIFKKPGPGSVGLPLDRLRRPEMMIDVEAIAMEY